jgi:hypothetical protein
MSTNSFISASFKDGLLYKPSDIKALMESETSETLKFVKIKILLEKLDLNNIDVLCETVDNLNTYKSSIESSKLEENTKKTLLTEISNLILGIIKFISPYIVKLLGWLVGGVVSTKTFGQAALKVSDAVKKVTPDAIKNALSYAKEKYQQADTAFQDIAKKVNDKVAEVFKGTGEKPPLIDGNAIAKAHSNLVSKIEKWPLVGKLVSLGKKIGISPQGFYTFLSITVLSILAMTGSFGAAVILVLYGANVAAQRLVSAGKEAGKDVASKAEQGMNKAKEIDTSNASSGDSFDELENMIQHAFDDDSTSNESALSDQLNKVSDKWSQKLKDSIDKGEKDSAVAKMKEAVTQLVKSQDIKKEEVGPFIKTIIKKMNANADLEKALLGAFSDIAVI